MIDFLIGLSISSLWITLAGLLVLFGLRILAAVVARCDLRTALLVVWLPLGIGYYRILPATTVLKRIYRILAVTTFAFALLASFWVFYTTFA